MKRYLNKGILMLAMIMFVLSSCSVSRHLDDNTYLLNEVKVISEHNQRVATPLKSKVHQHPNTRTFGLIRLPLRVYCLAGGRDNAVNRLLKNFGEPPRVYNDTLTKRSCEALRNSLVNQGYLRAEVASETLIRKHKAKVNYYVNPKELYIISSLEYTCLDSTLLRVIYADTVNTLLKVGDAFDASRLNEERIRITDYLQSVGYYDIKKEYITYVADTARYSNKVNLQVRIRAGKTYVDDEGNRKFKPFQKYRVAQINYLMYPSTHTFQRDFTFADTLYYDGAYYLYDHIPMLRPKVLSNAARIRQGDYYNKHAVSNSYLYYGRFNALKYTNINFSETSDSTLSCQITLHPAKKISTGFEVDLTNTAGDFGASGALSLVNRNLFRGSEVFTIKLRGAYENITHLSDYDSQYYVEYGADVSVDFPRFIMPFVSDDIQRRSKATTQAELQYNSQSRPEFDRDVFSASWSYLWNSSQHVKHRVDLLGINLVYVPRKDQNFINNYLEQYNSRNSIMKFNYEDLFIFRTGYNFHYTSPNASVTKDYFHVTHSVHAGIETAGNLLYAMSKALDSQPDTLGQYRLFNVAYAQYVKNDFFWTINMNFNHRNSLLFHIKSGVAFPYGNARMLPFEKRYYAGGANGVRGWSVRDLGPGSYVGRNGTVDYINHSGDIKLDLSLEYRTHLFWKFNGALFVDAGNIWTIYEYSDQPNGLFMWNQFYKQIAVSYGTGLRLDLNFLILRFDVAMKAINPAYSEKKLHYPIIYPKFRRDFAWHFAVGYPF